MIKLHMTGSALHFILSPQLCFVLKLGCDNNSPYAMPVCPGLLLTSQANPKIGICVNTGSEDLHRNRPKFSNK